MSVLRPADAEADHALVQRNAAHLTRLGFERVGSFETYDRDRLVLD